MTFPILTFKAKKIIDELKNNEGLINIKNEKNIICGYIELKDNNINFFVPSFEKQLTTGFNLKPFVVNGEVDINLINDIFKIVDKKINVKTVLLLKGINGYAQEFVNLYKELLVKKTIPLFDRLTPQKKLGDIFLKKDVISINTKNFNFSYYKDENENKISLEKLSLYAKKHDMSLNDIFSKISSIIKDNYGIKIQINNLIEKRIVSNEEKNKFRESFVVNFYNTLLEKPSHYLTNYNTNKVIGKIELKNNNLFINTSSVLTSIMEYKKNVFYMKNFYLKNGEFDTKTFEIYLKKFTNFSGNIIFEKQYNSIIDTITEISNNKEIEINNILLEAVKENNLPKVQEALAKGANINTQNNKGETPLLLACKNNNTTIGLLLLNSNANPNIKDNNNDTPLHLSVHKNNIVLTKALLNNGCNCLNDKDDIGDTPLILAVFNGHYDIVNLLLNSDVNINEIDSQGKTPLKLAIEKKDKKIITLLISHKDIDKKELFHNKDLSYFFDDIFITALKNKLKLKENPTALKKINENLIKACINGSVDDVLNYLKNGADVNYFTIDEEDISISPLLASINKKNKQSEAISFLLIEWGADINFSNNIKDTPLIQACYSCKKNLVKFLIEKGADINAQNIYKETPLSTSIFTGNKEIIEILLNNNPDIKNIKEKDKLIINEILESKINNSKGEFNES